MHETEYPDDRASRYLYRAGACTVLLFLIYLVATLLIFALVKGGFPKTATDCFAMFRENRFIAFLRLDIVSVVVLPFYYLLFFSIYQAIRIKNELLARIALFCTLAGMTIFICGINTTSIVTLSDRYNAATSHEYREQLLAACEALLAANMWENTGAVVSGILTEAGAILFSVIMVRTRVFNRVTGWLSVVTHCFDFSSNLLGVFSPFFKEIFTMVAGPLYIVWFIMIGIRLFQLGNDKENKVVV